MDSALKPRWTTLASVLGPADGRYFASGYKRVRYEVGAVDMADGGRIAAICSAAYPHGWSRDAGGDVRTPHLSSVDAIAIPILVLERVLQVPVLSSYRVSRIELRAPKQPHTDVGRIAVVLQVRGDPGRTPLSLDADVAGLRSHIELELSSRLDTEVGAVVDGTSVYSEGFRHTRVDTLLEDDNSSPDLSASHRFERLPESIVPTLSGVESSFAPAITALDLLVTMGQMTQAAIYLSIPHEQRRGDLWMRSMTINMDGPPPALPCTLLSTTRITRDRILDRSGEKLHNIDVESSMGISVRAWARLAYIEPRKSAEDEAGTA